MNEENRNMILAVVLSMIVLAGWFFLNPPEQPVETAQTAAIAQSGDGLDPAASSAGEATPNLDQGVIQTRDDALAQTSRIEIKTDRLSGSLSTTGAMIDDLQLTAYNERLNDESEKVTLLSPRGSDNAYFVLHGFTPQGSLTSDQVPNAATVWSVKSGDILTPETPVTLTWSNGTGLTFDRTITIDEDYLFTITQSVTNNTAGDVTLSPYGLIAQSGPISRAAYGRNQDGNERGVWILHEGIVLNTGQELTEIDYKDMPKEDFSNTEFANLAKFESNQDGWIGFTSKYWMTTLVPDASFEAVSKYSERFDRYQAEARQEALIIPAGQTSEITSRLFAGAKEYEAIKMYQDEAGIYDFVDSIDWGWFFFLTKPIFKVLHWLNGLIGNMGWAIIALTFLIKAVLLPLAYRSYVSMARMKQLQPEMEKLKEKHGDDRQAMQQDVIKLYREKKVNPAAGCLPILAQVPIFFSLYKVIFVTIELRHAPFFGWIQDLSVPDPSSIMNLFGLLPWGAPSPESIFVIFSIGVWPVLMGISMWLQQKLNPAPTDEFQARIFAWLPWVFMFMLGGFASGLVIYWVANNTLTFIQQYLIMRSQGVKPDIIGNIGLKRKKSA